MTLRTIEVSETAYQHLLTQAERLHLSPGHVVERLVLSDLLLLTAEEKLGAKAASLATEDPVDALAAVERLSTLFADLPLTNLEEHLADPMLAMTNSELDLLLQ